MVTFDHGRCVDGSRSSFLFGRGEFIGPRVDGAGEFPTSAAKARQIPRISRTLRGKVQRVRLSLKESRMK